LGDIRSRAGGGQGVTDGDIRRDLVQLAVIDQIAALGVGCAGGTSGFGWGSNIFYFINILCRRNFINSIF